MSTATWNNAAWNPSANDSLAQPLANQNSLASRWLFWAMFAVIGGAFFISEHNISISLAQDYTQNAEEMIETAAGGNWLRRLAFLAVAALGIYSFAEAKTTLWNIRWPLAIGMAAYVAWCFASYAWTIDSGMCFRRLMVFGCCVIGVLGVAKRFSMLQLTQLTLALTTASVVLGILCELRLGTFRPWSGGYRFSGTLHPNTQGMYLAAMCLSAFSLARSKTASHWSYWGLLAFGFLIVVLTKSRTATAAVLACIGAVLALQTSFRFKLLVGVACGWCVALGLLLLLAQGINPITDFKEVLLMGRSDDSESLSGRHSIWPEVLAFIGQRPWCGHGFESFWVPDHIETVSTACGWGIREAHNAYLETLLGTGIIGLGLVLGSVLLALGSSGMAYMTEGETTYGLPFGMIVFGFINAGLESGMVAVMLVTFLLACCLTRLAFFREAKNLAADLNQHDSVAGNEPLLWDESDYLEESYS